MISEIFTNRNMAVELESPWLAAEIASGPNGRKEKALSVQAWWRSAQGDLNGEILVIASNDLAGFTVLASIPVSTENCREDAVMIKLDCEAGYLKFVYKAHGINSGKINMSIYYSEAAYAIL